MKIEKIIMLSNDIFFIFDDYKKNDIESGYKNLKTIVDKIDSNNDEYDNELIKETLKGFIKIYKDELLWIVNDQCSKNNIEDNERVYSICNKMLDDKLFNIITNDIIFL